MGKFYFLKIWIKSLEKMIEISKQFSIFGWLKIAFVFLVISVISFLLIFKINRSIVVESTTSNFLQEKRTDSEPDILSSNLASSKKVALLLGLKEYFKTKNSNKEIVHIGTHFSSDSKVVLLNEFGHALGRKNSSDFLIVSACDTGSKEITQKFPQYKFASVSGYRTFKYQDKIYKQRKFFATDGQSYHNIGLAIYVDSFKNEKPVFISFEFWKENAKTVQKYGMERGQIWKNEGYAHRQVRRNVYKLSRKDYRNSVTSTTKIFLNTIQIAEEGKRVATTVGNSAASGKLQIISGNPQKNYTNYPSEISENFFKENQAIVPLEIKIENQKQNEVKNSALFSNFDLIIGLLTSQTVGVFFNLIYHREISFEELKRYFVNPFKYYVIKNDKSLPQMNWQFWLLLFNGIVNAIASISATILAWVSNNRARAEFLLKQAKDERDKLELELKIKTMELDILKIQKELGIKNPTIVLAR